MIVLFLKSLVSTIVALATIQLLKAVALIFCLWALPDKDEPCATK